MKATIDVKDRKEAESIRRGLDDPAVRAFVIVCGVLATLPNTRSRKRVLEWVADGLEEQRELANAAGTFPEEPRIGLAR